MTLTEYQRICTGLDNLCAYAWGGAPDGAELLKWAAELEAALKEEHQVKGEHLAESCRALVADYDRRGGRRSGAFKSMLSGLKQYLAKYAQIRELVADIEGGAVDLPEEAREALIPALNKIHKYCAKLSGVALREIENPKGGKTVPELIKSTPGALALAQAVAGYLTEDYKPKAGLTRRERGLIGREIGRALGRGYIAKVGQYWSISGEELSREAGKAEFDLNPKVVALKDILRGAGVKI